VRLIGSAVWEGNAYPLSNVGTTIRKADWERQTQHKCKSNGKRANREVLRVLGGAKYGKNADPLTNVETPITEGSWERLVSAERQPASSQAVYLP